MSDANQASGSANLDPTDDDLFGLTGKGVLISGASSVISIWTARLLRQVGARVVMTDRLTEEQIRAAMHDLAVDADDPGLELGDAVTLLGAVDLRNRTAEDVSRAGATDLVSVAEMVAAATTHLGRIDVLINIAGGQEPVPAAALTTELFRRTVDRILFGTWNVIHEVFDQSMREHGGRILSITADVDQGYPMMPGMGAARNALTSLHRALAVEWAPLGISTCVVAPGVTETPGLRRYPQAAVVRQIGLEASNQQRIMHPREVAWLFLTMASPWATGVNGHALVANGGDSFVTPLFREATRPGGPFASGD